MNKRLLLFLIGLVLTTTISAQLALKTKSFSMEISPKGEILKMVDAGSGMNYVPNGRPGQLLRIKSANQEINPQAVKVRGKLLALSYGNGIELQVTAKETADYIKFELTKVVGKEKIEAIFWGPFNTTIKDTIGEVVGVVRNSSYAIGMRALNAKTIGGKLSNEEGVTSPSASIAGSAASPEEFGSAMQAFAINQSLDRVITVWHHHKNCPVPGLKEYKLEGSAVAILGTSPANALATMGRINKAEGLPFPVIDGTWTRASRITGRPYLITDFTEENFDDLLSLTERLGFYSIYQEHPFDTWGHFDLNKQQFPNGRMGMKKLVEKATNKNIRVGVHTLTNFITTNDPFVTTALNSGLMAAGTSNLSADIDETATSIVVDGYEYFAQGSTLNSILIGNEIIRYQEVSKEKPYTLINCVRGTFNTKPAAHKKGAQVKKLMDFPYKTMFPNWEMQQQLIKNMAGFFNETGVSHMDFDGHEGACYTGRGDYAENYFADEFLKSVKHTVVNGSSIINHFYWNHNSYINWGEPWYASFRESQSEHRFRLQPFFERNYMPNMLGWFLVNADTQVEDVEWMMSVAAGYNAGYALVLRHNAFKKNPNIDKIIETIVLWEEAKKLGIFNKEQRMALKNPGNDFQLRKLANKEWSLAHFDKIKFNHPKKSLQPGEPTHTRFEFNNNGESQKIQLQFLIAGEEDAEVGNIELEIDNFFRITVPVTMKKGQTLVWDSSKEMKLYSDKGSLIRKINIEKELPEMVKGKHSILIDAASMTGGEPVIKGTVKLKGKMEKIQL